MLSIASCSNRKGSPPTAEVYEITLGGTISDVIDQTWPRKDNERREWSSIDSASTLLLSLPNGQKCTVPSMMTFIKQQEGKVIWINMLPLRSATSYPNAASETGELLRCLLRDPATSGFQRNPLLTSETPPWSPFNSRSINFTIKPNIQCRVEIKPSGTENEWYTVLSLSVE